MVVFLSHSNHLKDQPIINLVDLGFRIMGIDLYIAEREQRPSETFKNKLQTRIEGSDLVLVLYTIHASQSKDVNWEIGCAVSANKKTYFISEKGVKKPVAHEGEEHFVLDRTKLVESIYPVMTFFKSQGSGTEKGSVQKYGWEMLIASQNQKYKCRIRFPKGVELTFHPESLSASIMCTSCNLLLEERYMGGYSIWKCPSWSSYLAPDDASGLKAKTLSEYIRSGKWRQQQTWLYMAPKIVFRRIGVNEYNWQQWFSS